MNDQRYDKHDQHSLLEERMKRMSNLGHEHSSRWYFHVMSEFEVLEKYQRLFHADVAINLEAHVGNGISGIKESDDVLCDHVQSRDLNTNSLSINKCPL